MMHETSSECCRLFWDDNDERKWKVLSDLRSQSAVSAQATGRKPDGNSIPNTAVAVVVVEAGDNVTYAQSHKCGSGGIGRRARFRMQRHHF